MWRAIITNALIENGIKNGENAINWNHGRKERKIIFRLLEIPAIYTNNVQRQI